LITGDWIMASDDPKPAHAAPVHREVADVGIRLGPSGEAQPVADPIVDRVGDAFRCVTQSTGPTTVGIAEARVRLPPSMSS
jgi:hypothetical protein